MAKYLICASYTTQGVEGVIKEGGTGRRTAIETAAKALGGRVEALYFAFGPDDVYVIADLPDNVAATAFSIAVNRAGTAHAKVVVLLTPDEVDRAVKKSVDYRAPGN